MNNDLYIIHYGVGHDKGGHSGRYPWGSGENPKYPKKIYGGVNTEANRETYKTKLMGIREASDYATSINSLDAAKKYMKDTNKFISEHEMQYIKEIVENNRSRTRATIGMIASYYAAPFIIFARRRKVYDKEYLNKYKYLNKYIKKAYIR